jgi:hypothetical protein
MIAHWKGIVKEIHFVGKHKWNVSISPHFPKKHRLGPQNNSESFTTRKTVKNSKLPKLPKNCFEPIGKGGWSPISTWITQLQWIYGLIFKLDFQGSLWYSQ